MNKKTENLVFTSAGDNTKFPELWLSGERNFDLIVCYYGDRDDIFNYYRSNSKHAFRHKGSKFQNFYQIYKNQDLSGYQRIFILDDDIEFLSHDINQMFAISDLYQLKICQPSFDIESKAPWSITRQVKGSLLRYTNWVEVNTPLFTKKALDQLMEFYDPALIGWGIDYLYIWANGLEEKRSYAVIDSVICRNPKDEAKNGIRELSYVNGWEKRREIWEMFREKLQIKEWEKITHEVVSES